MEPNAPKDPLDPTPLPVPPFPEIPPAPQAPSEPFVPPAPPIVPPAPPTPAPSPLPTSFDVPPGAMPPPPSVFAESDTPPLPPPVSRFGGAFPPVAPAVPSTKDERLWATLIHLSGIVGASLAALFIPGNILLPLVLWLIKREGNPFVNDQGKEALNFQITVTIATIASGLLTMVFCIGLPFLIVVGVASLVLSIIGAIKANEGVAYRYPFTLRLIH